MNAPLPDLEATLGYEFVDKQLLGRALIHSSYGAESSLENNETLEFLGDAVLDLVLSELMMKEHPDYDEGELTQLRAALVNATHLANVARELDLGACIQLGRGEKQSGGHEKERILAACYEAILGAVFLDAGYEAARSVAVEHFEDAVRSPSTAREDFKTKLQEHTQRVQRMTPTYSVTKVTGPDHDRRYEVELRLGDEALGNGCGRSRKHAEQEAAEAALARLTADEEDGHS
jgi:ribonuclease-3